jgi:hypothetical protein
VRKLRLQCSRAIYEHSLKYDKKKVKRTSLDLVDSIMENLTPKMSIVYIDSLADELKDPELVLPLMEGFEKVSWSRGDRNGSLVIGLKRAEILLGTGNFKTARRLLQNINKKAVKIGFKAASRKAGALLSRLS